MKTKKYIKLFFIFIFSICALECINRYFYVERKSTDFKVYKQYLRRKNNIEILFLGDSHFTGISQDFLDKKSLALNLKGGSFFHLYCFLKKHLQSSESLKVLVLPVDLHSFSSYRLETSHISKRYYFWSRFIRFKDLYQLLGMRAFLCNVYKLTLLDDNYRNDKDYGKDTIVSDAIDVVLVKNEADKHFKNSIAIDDRLVDYLKKILELCEIKNIKVVLISTPLSKEYVEYSKQYIAQNEIYRRVINKEELSRKIYGYKNYQDLFKNKNECFNKDGHHLSKIGAHLFTSEVSEYTNKILED